MGALGWPIRTWDYWNWSDVDHRFGDEWDGRIPAQLVAHALRAAGTEGLAGDLPDSYKALEGEGPEW